MQQGNYNGYWSLKKLWSNIDNGRCCPWRNRCLCNCTIHLEGWERFFQHIGPLTLKKYFQRNPCDTTSPSKNGLIGLDGCDRRSTIFVEGNMDSRNFPDREPCRECLSLENDISHSNDIQIQVPKSASNWLTHLVYAMQSWCPGIRRPLHCYMLCVWRSMVVGTCTTFCPSPTIDHLYANNSPHLSGRFPLSIDPR